MVVAGKIIITSNHQWVIKWINVIRNIIWRHFPKQVKMAVIIILLRKHVNQIMAALIIKEVVISINNLIKLIHKEEDAVRMVTIIMTNKWTIGTDKIWIKGMETSKLLMDKWTVDIKMGQSHIMANHISTVSLITMKRPRKIIRFYGKKDLLMH